MEPETARIWQHAEALYQQGRYDLAEVRYRELTARLPGNVSPMFWHALSLRFLHRHAEAIEVAQETVRLAPADPATHLALALALLGCHMPADAIAPAMEVIRLIPDKPAAYGPMAMAHYLSGNYELATTYACRGLSLDGLHRSLRFISSLALAAAGRREESRLAIDSYVSERPDEDALAHAGWAFWHMGEPGEAVDYLRRSLAINSRDAWPHEGIGLALYDLGRIDDARRSLAEALRIDPTSPRASRLLAQLGQLDAGTLHAGGAVGTGKA